MAAESPTAIRRAHSSDRDAILAIHRERKRTLGHMPHAPFDAAIESGRVIVAERASAIVGYLLYGVRKRTNEARVDHLAVTAEVEGSGVAHALVERLLHEVSDLRGVVLKCRQDYAAHDFWQSAGFEAVGEGPGKSREGLLLTHFERRLHQEQTLFDLIYQESSAFAVDLNVLLDLATRRNDETVAIFQQLDQFDVHPIRTVTLSNELLGYPDLAVREDARRIASIWDRSSNPAASHRVEQLAHAIPGADKGDLEHLACAEAAGVDVLLTQDRDFIEAVASAGHGVTSVEVLHPAQYLDRLFIDDGPDYLPAFVRGLRVEPASAFTQGVLADLFVGSDQGETKAGFRSKLAKGLAESALEARCLTQGGAPACLYFLRRSGDSCEIELLRVVGGPRRATLLRQALAHLRLAVASEARVTGLKITEQLLRQKDGRSLRAEGFLASAGSDSWKACAIAGVMSTAAVTELLRDADAAALGEPAGLSEALEDVGSSPEAHGLVEALLDPLLINDGSMPSVLVPIQAHWSDRLIGLTHGQLDLEIASGRIHQLREHVYFRSPRGLGLTAPSRVFWYRTAEGVSQVFATSVIEQVLVRGIPETWGRFGGYGVLQKSDIQDLADDAGRVMALRFSRTRRLVRGVPLAELQHAADGLGLRQPAVPVGPLRLDPRLQSWLLGSEVGPE